MNKFEELMVETTRNTVNKVIKNDLGWPPYGCIGFISQPKRPKIEVENNEDEIK